MVDQNLEESKRNLEDTLDDGSVDVASKVAKIIIKSIASAYLLASSSQGSPYDIIPFTLGVGMGIWTSWDLSGIAGYYLYIKQAKALINQANELSSLMELPWSNQQIQEKASNLERRMNSVNKSLNYYQTL